jgi:hypothetical protein
MVGKLLYWPLCVVLLAICTSPGRAQMNYSKSVDLPPLRISYAELQTVLDKAASLMNTTNMSAPLWREDMELRKGGIRIRIPGHQLKREGARLPEVIDRFEYTAWSRDPAPVGRLNLSFSDFSRTLSIEGQSPDQVDAVFSALRDDLWNLSTSIGGAYVSLFRYLFGVFLAVGVLILTAVWAESRDSTFLTPALFCAVLLAALILLPIGDWLSGFAAVRGDASFVVRYGAEISFLALIVGLIALSISLVPLVRPTGGKNPTT